MCVIEVACARLDAWHTSCGGMLEAFSAAVVVARGFYMDCEGAGIYHGDCWML